MENKTNESVCSEERRDMTAEEMDSKLKTINCEEEYNQFCLTLSDNEIELLNYIIRSRAEEKLKKIQAKIDYLDARIKETDEFIQEMEDFIAPF